jgi:hypothetical protein
MWNFYRFFRFSLSFRFGESLWGWYILIANDFFKDAPMENEFVRLMLGVSVILVLMGAISLIVAILSFCVCGRRTCCKTKNHLKAQEMKDIAGGHEA